MNPRHMRECEPHWKDIARESDPHWSDIAAEVEQDTIRREYRPRFLPPLAAKVMANEWKRQKEWSRRKGIWRPSREK